MPIRLRLAGLFALGTAALIAVTGFVFASQLRARLLHSLDSGLKPKRELTASSVRAGTIGARPDGAPTVLAGAHWTQVYDGAGRLVATSGDLFVDDHDGRPQVPTRLVSATQATSPPGGPVIRSVQFGHETIRSWVEPVARGDGTWLVVVGDTTASVTNALARVRHAVEYYGPPAIALAGVAAWLVAGGALRPVERMRREVAKVSDHGGRSAIVVPSTHDEIAKLAETMNEVLGQLKRALDRERQFVTDAGHELRTPLAILQAELELAGRPGRSHDELAAALESAAGEVHRLVVLAEDLLALGRDTAIIDGHEPVQVSALARESAAAFGPRSTAAEVGIRCQLDESVIVEGRPRQLRRALDNLIDNALHFAPPGSEITVTISRTGTSATLEVADEGPGFPADFLPDAFERFRRADAARNRHAGGAGLGLAIVREVADAHGGRAVAANRPGGGAAVRLEVPCRPVAAAPTPAGTSPSAAVGSGSGRAKLRGT